MSVEIRSISAAAALKVTAIVFAVLIALRFLWIAHAIFIVTILGVLLGLGVARAVDFLEKYKVRRGLGAAITMILVIGLLIGIGAMVAPAMRRQTGEIAKELPKVIDQIEQKFGSSGASKALGLDSAQQKKQGGLSAQLTKELRGATKFLFPLISSVFGAIGGLVIVLFIGLYIAAEPGKYRDGILHLVPHRSRPRAREVLTILAETLRQWLIARLIAMVAIGLITGTGLALLGVKGAAALGLFAGLMELIPFFGPFVSAIPAIGIALVDSPQKALAVVVLYVIVQQLEGNVITPLILEKRLDIPPVLTVVGVSAMAIVFGVMGMLVAEPLLAAALVLSKMLYVEDVVGDDVKVGKNG